MHLTVIDLLDEASTVDYHRLPSLAMAHKITLINVGKALGLDVSMDMTKAELKARVLERYQNMTSAEEQKLIALFGV